MAAPRFNVQSIAIIGAGPSGIAAAKYLVAEKAFQKIDVFEQRAKVGGIWDYHNAPKGPPERLATPQLDPHTGPAKPIWENDVAGQALGSDVEEKARFLSPVYDRLETNIPKDLMGFSDFEWPQDAQLFPKHETVAEYLKSYAEDVKHLVNFQTQVLDVKLIEEGGRERWIVETQEIKKGNLGEVRKSIYDAVVVASGHFFVPYIPNVQGMKDWGEKYPGALSHSMYYKRPEDYQNKKVIVVGNGPSGLDIATQIMTTCKKPLVLSARSESMLLSDPSPTRLEKPEITEFILEDRSLRFRDGSIEKNVDVVLYATGYFYSFPFLRSLDPPLIVDGTHVHDLYQHLLYRQHPTMAFLATQQRIIPFPMAEAQGAVVSRLWSGRLALPSDDEMKAWEDKTYEENGDGREFHLLAFPKDANYINDMHDWAMSAPDAATRGKTPPRWGAKERWMRERFPAIKKAFQDRGDDRHKVTTLKELGFDFDEYINDKLVESKSLL